MSVLIKKLAAGYGIATLLGFWLVDDLVMTAMIAWLGGGALSLAIVWVTTPALSVEAEDKGGQGTAPASEFAMWDADLAAERINAEAEQETVKAKVLRNTA